MSEKETVSGAPLCLRLVVAYDGTGFAGWQRQKNTAHTVQEVLEDALSRILSRRVCVSASGRTDAGVHALGQSVHLLLPLASPPSAGAGQADDLLRSLVLGTNSFLPEEIRVLKAERMPAGFHARTCSTSKLYRYRWDRSAVVLPQRSRYVSRIGGDLEVPRMREALEKLVGRHDFAAFAKTGGAHETSVRTLFRAALLEEGEVLTLEVEGDGFLRGMVRAIAGTLVEVGRHQRSVASVERLLGSESAPNNQSVAKRSEAGPNAPAQGLCLVRVSYEEPWLPLEPGYPAEANSRD